MADTRVAIRTGFKLVIWSVVVGFVLYHMKISPGDIYGWIANTFAGIWEWTSGSGIEYMLLGATIVVPIFLISWFRNKNRG